MCRVIGQELCFLRGLYDFAKKDRRRQRPKTLPNYNPFKDPHIEGEPEKTLFVARIDYKTTEESLKNAFEKYGTIENLHLVRDVNSGQSKGYAFIVYKHSSEQRKAYKEAHRMMLDGRQVLVDKERSRIEMNWKPRRLGGGLGQRKKGTQRFKKTPYFGDPKRIKEQDYLNKEREKLRQMKNKRKR